MRFLIACALLPIAWPALAFETNVTGISIGPIRVRSDLAEGWRIAAGVRALPDGTEEVSFSLSSESERFPPCVSLSFDVPAVGVHHKFTGCDPVFLPPDWGSSKSSQLCSLQPLVSFSDDADRNRMLVAASETRRTVKVEAGFREEECRLACKILFFARLEAPLRAYSASVRIDRRDVYFGDAVRSGVDWMTRTALLKPCAVPLQAHEPVYSTWYAFHQDLKDGDIEAECRRASELGLKTLIVDDGWQTDDVSRGYAFCGDWQVSKRRFPEMAAHVARVHALGLKYMLWYGLPMVGTNSANYVRFSGKYLWHQQSKGCSFLDPRFPEVRDFLCETLESAVREWDVDGFKLDFLDSIGTPEPDPAVLEGYRGRDMKSVSAATELLLTEIQRRVRALKPDALIEFRQNYTGPAIRQYGNMLRASDCPGDFRSNRIRIANARLVAGSSAVHSDMLEWNVGESAENAARFVLSTLFSSIQCSMMLRTLPELHWRMLCHWLSFARQHRASLLFGSFRPRHPEAGYPLIEAEDETERLFGVYMAGTVVDASVVTKPTYVLNGTGADELVISSGADCLSEAFDTFGNVRGKGRISSGMTRVKVPVSGYVLLLPLK